jgi:acyl-CoA reductase-like NAD-dependent aldehyde dehydrogenase
MDKKTIKGLYINGKWIDKKEKISVKNPYNGEEIGSVSLAESKDVENAINSAGEAFINFKDCPLHIRAGYLRGIARRIEERKDHIARIITLESGKAIRFSKGEVDRAVSTFNFAANEAEKLSGETIPMDASKGGEGRFGFFIRVPLGVIAAITPFNFPLNLPAHKIAPAIAAGDTIVWKPSSETPLTAAILTEIIDEVGIPPGVLNLIFGPGSEIGEILSTHQDIKLISFTGSVPVGERIRKISGMKRTLLELGSNSALVIDGGVENLDEVVKRSIIGVYANSGQICISIQRIYVHESLFEKFTDLFVSESKKVCIGDPLSPEVLYGPMITEKEAERVELWVQNAIDMGAQTLLPGKRDGSIISPVVLTHVTPEMDVVSKEVFGPVVSIMPFKNFDDAIKMVNNSIYGLNAGFYTPRIDNALKAIRQCEVGSVIINDYPTFRVDQMPYGGVKMSGMGREGPPFAIEEYTEIRFACMR